MEPANPAAAEAFTWGTSTAAGEVPCSDPYLIRLAKEGRIESVRTPTGIWLFRPSVVKEVRKIKAANMAAANAARRGRRPARRTKAKAAANV